MKESFPKDIVERPRNRADNFEEGLTGTHIRKKNPTPEDIESLDMDALTGHYNQRIKGDKDKTPSDNFGISKSFLRSHVGQSWDSVYSEIKKTLDRRALMKWHAHVHLVEDFVEQNAFIGEDGIVYHRELTGTLRGPAYHRQVDGYYVHPETHTLEYQHIPIDKKRMKVEKEAKEQQINLHSKLREYEDIQSQIKELKLQTRLARSYFPKTTLDSPGYREQRHRIKDLFAKGRILRKELMSLGWHPDKNKAETN